VRQLTLKREEVDIPVVESRLERYHGEKIAWVHLAGFTAGAHGEVDTAVLGLLHKGAKGVVFDLRQNGGGLLDEAVQVASIFIPDGRIVSTRGRNRPEHVYNATGDAISTKIPVAVLVDGQTASASEIVTSALQDHHRAVVVGTHTYGKGVFQEIERLSNGGALDITVGEYFTPNGRNLGGGGVKKGAGITPDIRASDNPKTKPDEALQAALRAVAAGR
jgi:carboxyl-terminal processing protease